MKTVDKLHLHLSKHNYSRTAARDMVYLAINEIGPCTKHELAGYLSSRIDQSTVYRTVTLFLNIGVADMIRFHLLELSDRFKQHHHHFLCNSCGREINFNDDELEQVLHRFATARGLQLTDHQVELAGLCADCSSAALSSSSTRPVS